MTISYSLPCAGTVTIGIYDVHGRKIATLQRKQSPAGQHSLVWNGKDDVGVPVIPGMYVLKVDIDSGPSILKKLIKM